MKQLDTNKLELLLSSLQDLNREDRFKTITNELLGKDYVSNSLIGSSTKKEELYIDIDAFDCVTFIETVIALLRSENIEDFNKNLINIRYKDSKIDWPSRNHYFSEWIDNNKDIISIIDYPNKNIVEKDLSILENYPIVRKRIPYIAVEEFSENINLLKTSDILVFGSTKSDLDFAHVGFYVKESNSLIHGSKKEQKVVLEPIEDFIERFGGTPGVLVLRLA